MAMRSGCPNWQAILDARWLRSKTSAVAPAFIFGLRLSASVSLALFLAFWLQLDDPSWAGTSAAVVCQPNLGASLRKGWYRMIGTSVGAVAIVLLTACFIQNRVGFLVALILWSAACAAVATLLRNFASYAAALAGYSAAIVAADILGTTGGANGEVFTFAVYRASEICVGIVSAGVILAGTDFGGARRRLATLFATLSADIAGRFADTLLTDGLLDMRPIRRELIGRVIALDPAIDQAIGESSELRYHSPILQRAVGGLFAALAGWRAVANRLTSAPHDRQSRHEVDTVQKCIPRELREAPDHRTSTDWTADPVHLRKTCLQAVRALVSAPASAPSSRLLLDQTARVFVGLAQALRGLALLVADPARSPPAHERFQLHVPDWLPPLHNAGRAVVAIAAASLWWVVTGWPSGATCITWTAIAVVVFGPKADQAYAGAMSFWIGAALAAACAALWKFVVFPQLQSFTAFSIAMACYLVPVGALSAQTRGTALFASMAGRFVPLISPANQMSYDTVQFYNLAAAVLAGTGIAALSYLLLPPLSPAAAARRLLALTLRDLRRLVRNPVPQKCQHWRRAIYARLAALPASAEPLQRAQMLAALSVGTEIIRLHRIAHRLCPGASLEPALQAIAQGSSTVAREELVQIDQALSKVSEAGVATRLPIRARSIVLELAELLTQHASYFDSVP